MPDVAKLSFSWSARRVGNNGFVLESTSDGSHEKEFGPMPAYAVPSFIYGRRKLVEAAMKDLGHTKQSSPIDWSILK